MRVLKRYTARQLQGEDVVKGSLKVVNLEANALKNNAPHIR